MKMNSSGQKWKTFYALNDLPWFNHNIKRDISYFKRMFNDSEIVVALVSDLESDKTLAILEAGCGTAELSICLSLKYDNVTAFDYNEKAIEIAFNLMDQAGREINVYVDDLLNLKLCEKKYDLIFNQAVFEYFRPSERRIGLKKIKSLLKPGGRISIIAQNTSHPIIKKYGHQPNVYRLTPKILISEFKSSGFKKIKCKGLFSAKIITNIFLAKNATEQTRYNLYRIIRKIPLPSFLHKSLGSQFLVTGIT